MTPSVPLVPVVECIPEPDLIRRLELCHPAEECGRCTLDAETVMPCGRAAALLR